MGGERLTEETFARYRARGGLVVIDMIPDDALQAALTHSDVMIGSDGVPLTNGGGHPRGVGTYLYRRAPAPQPSSSRNASISARSLGRPAARLLRRNVSRPMKATA